jgi:hypothetical protein
MSTRMKYSEIIVSLFHELVLFWKLETTYDEMSPTEKVLGENAYPAWCFRKIPEPQNRGSFPFDTPKHYYAHIMGDLPSKGVY